MLVSPLEVPSAFRNLAIKSGFPASPSDPACLGSAGGAAWGVSSQAHNPTHTHTPHHHHPTPPPSCGPRGEEPRRLGSKPVNQQPCQMETLAQEQNRELWARGLGSPSLFPFVSVCSSFLEKLCKLFSFTNVSGIFKGKPLGLLPATSHMPSLPGYIYPAAFLSLGCGRNLQDQPARQLPWVEATSPEAT